MNEKSEYSADGRGMDEMMVGNSGAKTEDAVSSEEDAGVVTYTIEDIPSWPLCIILGFQHYLTACGSTLSLPLLLAGPLCVIGDEVGVSELIGTVFFVSGLATLLQTTFGIRLPIVQGITFAFLAPTFSILALPQWQCPAHVTVPADDPNNNATKIMLAIVENVNKTSLEQLGSEQHRAIWQSRVREIQGAVMVASVAQIVIGFSGMLSLVLRYIGPLVVAPTVTLVGLFLFQVAAQKASSFWWIALLTLALIVIFSQCLNRVDVPLPRFSVTKKGCTVSTSRIRLFGIFPVLLAIILSWILCLLLTVTNMLPSDPDQWGYTARTDTRTSALRDTPWIHVPFPGQWGVPTVSVGAVLGMLGGVLASMIESVGDYYACARLSGAPPPPAHAVNRGIGMEGIACLLAGAFGSGNGTTSYSENVAAIGITKVASRRVVQVTGLLLVVLGCLGKVGAIFVTIPDPVVGGMFIAMFAMITAVGLSNIRYVDMRKPRNMCVLGLAMFLGLAVPFWVSANKTSIDTGYLIVDQIIEVLLSTSMFVGGFVGFVLDNLLPGTDEERGIKQWRQDSSFGEKGNGDGGKTHCDPYDFSLFLTCIRRLPWLGRLPFCPTSKSRTPVVNMDQLAGAGINAILDEEKNNDPFTTSVF